MPANAASPDRPASVLAVRAERGGAEPILGPVPRDASELLDLARARIPGPERSAALEPLREVWERQPLSDAEKAAVERLQKPETRIVIGGQQPALGGGPLYLIVKALSVSALARWLRDAGIPSVPIFWIADEDHDVKELRAGAFPRADGALAEIDLPFAAGRRPLADLRLEGDGRGIAQSLAALLPDTDERDGIVELLHETADASPSIGFERLLHALLPDEGILTLRPGMLRRVQAPIIARELHDPGALARDVEEVTGRLRELSLPVPIPRPATVPFFVIGDDGGRHRLEAVDGGFRSRAPGLASVSTVELAALLEREPERFSPDALLRPLVQDALLQPLATVLGPTEMAYHLELAAAYPKRNIPRPVLMPRLQVFPLEIRHARRLRRAGIDPADLGPSVPVERLVVSPLGEAWTREIEAAGARVLGLLRSLEDREGITENLKKRTRRLYRRWQSDLERLGQAIHREVDTSVEDQRRAVAEVRAALWPGGLPAERQVSVLYAIARYGREMLRRIADLYDPFHGDARFLTLTPLSSRSTGRRPDESRETTRSR